MLKYYQDILDVGLSQLNWAGVHPAKPSNVRRIIVSLLFVLYTGLVMLGFILEENNLENVTGLMFTACTIIHILAQFIVAIFKAGELRELLQSIDSFWPMLFKTKSAEKERRLRSLRRLKLLLNCFKAYSQLTACVNLFVGLLTKTHMLKYFVPKSTSPEVSIVFEIFFVECCLLIAIGFDVFFTALLYILSVQFKLLNNKFATLDFGKQKSEKWYSSRIRKYALYHKFLLQQTINLNSIFGPMLLVFLWNFVVMLCLLVYTAITDNGRGTSTIARDVICLFALTAEVAIFYFLPSQWLIDEASKTIESIYSSNWYLCSHLSVKKSLIIIMTKSQEDTTITAGGLFLMNLETGTDIYKSVFSLSMFALRMRKKIADTS